MFFRLNKSINLKPYFQNQYVLKLVWNFSYFFLSLKTSLTILTFSELCQSQGRWQAFSKNIANMFLCPKAFSNWLRKHGTVGLFFLLFTRHNIFSWLREGRSCDKAVVFSMPWKASYTLTCKTLIKVSNLMMGSWYVCSRTTSRVQGIAIILARNSPLSLHLSLCLLKSLSWHRTLQ